VWLKGGITRSDVEQRTVTPPVLPMASDRT
jgi:hypothetical protein